jgi:hypothetical protein
MTLIRLRSDQNREAEVILTTMYSVVRVSSPRCTLSSAYPRRDELGRRRVIYSCRRLRSLQPDDKRSRTFSSRLPTEVETTSRRRGFNQEHSRRWIKSGSITAHVVSHHRQKRLTSFAFTVRPFFPLPLFCCPLFFFLPLSHESFVSFTSCFFFLYIFFFLSLSFPFCSLWRDRWDPSPWTGMRHSFSQSL